jgi:twitching motility protein PilT
MGRMEQMLVSLREKNGSDLHLAAGQPPRMRRKGSLDAIEGEAVLDDAGLRALLREIATPEQWQSFEAQCDLDFAYGIPGVARFRANYFAQENGAAAVFRIIPEEILTLEQLELPKSIRQFAHLDRGLVLVTGPTGSGKSTTLAAIINEINEAYAKHVLTIEDPIEFVHANKQSVFSHREVGIHTQGFAPALRAALREDADVILVGEMRDYETISLALTAAEMGTLVFGTLHTNGAAKTIDRVIDAFPADEQPQARLSLSESLAGVVSQQLLRTADGKGRCAANEVLIRTSGLANVIREGNTPMLLNIIQSGKSAGMQTMDDALLALVQSNRIRPEDAYFKATEKARFEKYAPAD